MINYDNVTGREKLARVISQGMQYGLLWLNQCGCHIYHESIQSIDFYLSGILLMCKKGQDSPHWLRSHLRARTAVASYSRQFARCKVRMSAVC